MKKTKLFNKKAIVIIPIVLALILGSVGTMGLVGGFINQPDANESQPQYLNIDDLKKMIDNETVLKVMDIHENLDKYIDKTQTFEMKFFEFEDGYSVGVEYSFEDGEPILFDIPADFSTIELPDTIQNNDWVKVTGKIGKIDEVDNDHTHTVPIFHISSIEKIDK